MLRDCAHGMRGAGSMLRLHSRRRVDSRVRGRQALERNLRALLIRAGRLHASTGTDVEVGSETDRSSTGKPVRAGGIADEEVVRIAVVRPS